MLANLKTQIQPPVGIIGLGKSGLSAKKLLSLVGYSSKEIVTFDNNPSGASSANTPDYSCDQDFLSQSGVRSVIVSPGFPLEHTLIKSLREQGVKITSEINLASFFLKNENVIGITGSLGKSTTTSLIGAGLKAIDDKAFVGGNLGTPFCEYAINLVESSFKSRAQWLVLELSSYQLENMSELKLAIAAITYLTPNHLERYQNLEHYYETKWSIFNHGHAQAFLNKKGGDLFAFANKKISAINNTRAEQEIIWADPNDMKLKDFSLTEANILGKHNQDNLALAAHILLATGLNQNCIDAMKKFSGLSHRLEVIKKTKDILIVNDSKATTIDSVMTAVNSCLEERLYQRVLLLLGGKDKQLPWLQLKSTLQNPKVKVIYFGYSGLAIKSIVDIEGPYFNTLNTLLENIETLLQPKDILLFSPGGTSHDEFKNFEERGDFFKKHFNL
ncbi:MAG: UDP-N-acetylmuramoyl-L-alanine--D-glutamate ligase [Bdellovibrionaceae bacterium]|nr:UDP-N-acetylmuramoyl-L-alanine--D-glutamate ligase [Pseudobdellovibrionaceae bacterium]NUM57559.1 UDP-N-acetylmuramoyl-L-alanine--D-glutamate ligase [Pseudobdellovibrionaceae bacterium]